jgi:taurine dioxygenase
MAQTKTSPQASSIDIRPLTGALGCEISGIDIATIDDAAFAQIRQAFLDYSAVLFHDQELTQEQFAEFGKRFGKLEDEPFLPNRADVPGVYYFRGAPQNAKSLSTQKLGWHADHTYQKNPSFGAVLYAIDVPEAGGDTLLASNYLSYAGLSPAMQEFLDDKIAIHDVLQYGLKSGHNSISTVQSIEKLAAMRKKFPPVEHPLICVHPETGRKMLYINQAWTVGIKDLAHEESEAILTMLKQHSLKDVYRCRVRYRNKSLLLWDNRAVQHSPNSDYDRHRYMWRLALHSDWEPGK